MAKVKSTILTIFASIGIFCIIYYTSKFYMERHLCFTDKMLVGWTIVGTLICISLIIGIASLWKIDKIERQNDEMKDILLKMSEDSEEYYDSLCHHLQNSRELSLDIFNKMQERS